MNVFFYRLFTFVQSDLIRLIEIYLEIFQLEFLEGNTSSEEIVFIFSLLFYILYLFSILFHILLVVL